MKLNKLMQLLRDNAAARAEGELAIRLEDEGADEPHIYVYDVIDSWWGANAKDLITALAAVGNRATHVHVNSPGGDVFEARAMAAAIVAHPGQVHMHIDGLAASAATYFALSGNTCSITTGGMMMVHECWTLAYGNKRELRKTADLLDQIDDTIIDDYARRTGKPVDEVRGWVEAETWFKAERALELGFVDSVEPNTKREADASKAQAASAARWNLSAYANAPKFDVPPPAPDPAQVTALAAQQVQANRNRMRLLAHI